jgi:hypothetical protein
MSKEEVAQQKAEEEFCHNLDSIINRPKTTIWEDFCDGVKTKWENFKSWF